MPESTTGTASSMTTRIDFQLDRDYIELNQLLKLTGVCDSGGAGKALVAGGMVSANGITELRKTRKIHAGDVVTFQDVEIRVIGVSAN